MLTVKNMENLEENKHHRGYNPDAVIFLVCF